MTKYFIYILQCSDQTLYTGISTNLKRRVTEHNSSGLGAKYTRGRRPVRLVYFKKMTNRSLATRAEAKIKKLSRPQKLFLINSN